MRVCGGYRGAVHGCDCPLAPLLMNVLGLADVFESFRRVMPGQSGRRSSHRMPAVGLSRFHAVHTVRGPASTLPQHHHR